ncbi:MAG TPA: hypothetical protein VMG08_01045 [Allosphingosinicella sp.]|nr:hypothetical protein [Allosphingosinicella sp.]
MRADQDGILLVRADLCERLDMLQKAAQRLSVREFMSQIGAIRTLALAYGLLPVVAVADALARAIAAEPRGCPAGLYFDRLRDAIGCDRLDAAAEQALLASVSIRLGA